ncbi:hypothetical protein [Shewanella decolorationis]|uniref:Uncharacterized protein n=1 Tax=Shewanella decolorationis S12 TaxID=1353536 RepID=A0ABN0PQ79_9GAMM|nr:hypothetical protein [Shewanella decolorationis]ESE42282.1 hypothetical protein SHD_1021 [Shewanella decolorationis S12]
MDRELGMSSQELAALDKAIAKGKWFFILVVGVLFWGGMTSLVVATIHYLTSDTSFWGELARALCIYPVAGILFGWFDWVRLQRKRDRLRAEYYQPHNE